MEKYELPKLKVKVSKYEILEVKRFNEKKIICTLCVLAVFFLLGILSYMFLLKRESVILKNETSISSIDIISYNDKESYVIVSLGVSTKQNACAFSEEKVGKDKLKFEEMIDEKCTITIPLKPGYVYFKNSRGIIGDALELTDYVVDFKVKDKYYYSMNKKDVLLKDMVVVGKPTITISSNSVAVNLDNFNVSSNVKGKSLLTLANGKLQKKEVEVVVTDTIVEMPKLFDSKKKFLACEQFSEEEALLLDEILAYRVADAGYATRAGVVAVARFITLEFPYKISYYFENGRLNGTGTHYVDGEGRYYHKGLYLSESKYKDLVPGAKLQGPKMWGCKMKSYEDDRANGYIPGGKYPNGLDCSGFVSWVLYNGGFDVGDGGAGESPYIPGQMTDTGKYKRLTQTMIDRGEVRVGDLLNVYGHIAIIAGDDGENFYVAESLNNYKGVVLNKYSKKKVIKSFPYVVFMDTVYKSDGNLTNMWY